ncbi:DUF721 domain-containing protein [Sanguibacteroides justesenii]|uniref:Uncharacterized protein n=2 Tax=Bacteroidales TaxID=171549 RepID=A0A0C3MJB0_9PORP|nr:MULTISPECIES: DUF721 domain-containing protein [Porphyromonadaceae]KIO46753.1 hypothetical protein BA92_02520 [Sanguibacteroides justesenii]KIO46859.1 hypothetical protein IE90_02230 [Sanguibacteroides justesenii]PXZ43485.1 DUF721 domain-containing protein [Sanguibacteroides justesenii]
MDELMRLYLKQMGLTQRFKEREVCQLWPEVVGGMIASKTKNLRMVDGKLFVSFSSSVVKNEILLVKEGLLKALNDRVGEGVVKELIVS